MIYKQKSSKYYWYSVYVPGSGIGGKRQKLLRGSTGVEDIATAKAIEETIKMSLLREAPADKLHALIDVLTGTQKKTGLPVEVVFLEHERFLTATKKTLSPKTLTDRKRACERLINWCSANGISYVEQINKQTALRYAEHLARQGTKGKTRANAIGNLSAVWGCLMRTQEHLVNPWMSVMPEKNDSERGLAFTRDDEESVFNAAKEIDNGWFLACTISRHSGLRYSDVAGLKWQNIDFDKLAIRITPQKTARHGIDVVIPFNDEINSLLQAELKQKTSDFILPHFAAALPNGFRCPRFCKVLKAAGLAGKGYTFHSWRHTFRTRLSEAGVSDDIAKRLGGWTDDKTVQRYDHAERLDELRAAIEKSRTLSE